jgi:hypothetical protein
MEKEPAELRRREGVNEAVRRRLPTTKEQFVKSIDRAPSSPPLKALRIAVFVDFSDSESADPSAPRAPRE